MADPQAKPSESLAPSNPEMADSLPSNQGSHDQTHRAPNHPRDLTSIDLNGLTTADVAQRVKQGDTNVVVLRSSRTYADIFKENVFTLFNITFAVILGLMVLLGQITDAIFSGFSVFSNIIVGVVQEIQAKHTLDGLALLSVQQVTVRRNGQSLMIPVHEVVRDDLIEIKPGDRAPVDGPVVSSQNVEMDESLLTGESDPVAKQIGDVVLSGSFCLAGSCVYIAEKIGNESYAVQLSQSSRVYKRIFTPLQKKIDTLVEIFLLGLIVAIFLHGSSSVNIGRSMVDTIRYASVIVNSFVPAGLVLSISVAFALGAVAISKRRTLIQKINAVDSMNSVRVLCTDKTGTLTQNKLLVRNLEPLADTTAAQLQQLVALYANLLATPNSSAKAMAEFTHRPDADAATNIELAAHPKAIEIPFSSARKWGAVSLASPLPDGTQTIVVGAPEILFQDETSREIGKQFGRQGLRAIAVVTSAHCYPVDLPKSPDLPPDCQDRGLVLLEDGLRPDVIDTLAALQEQNIRVKVISGDSVETVASIARQAGIAVPDDAIYTQKALEQMGWYEFSHAAVTGTVFGRIVPEMKRKLVSAMVKRGSYVAMVGDGVNDVPAFKEAQLAIAMNDGAQISKDIADMVLLDNNLAALPQAFREGDLIKQKILNAALLYLSKNCMVILCITFTGFVQLPFPVEPRQMTLLTLSTVGIPTIWIALGWLKPKRIKNFLQDVLGYSLVAGTLGAVAMTLGYVLTFYLAGIDLLRDLETTVLASSDLHQAVREQAQAVSTSVGMIFGLFVFWDSTNVSVWQWGTLMRNRNATAVGLVSLIISMISMLAMPRLFQIDLPNQLCWTLILFLPFAAHYTLRMLNASPLLRRLIYNLTQN
jgi:cation-transporting ATPase E